MAAAQPTEILSQPHGIINDSALAAVELPNGDRRVFFQKNDGYIRQAIYLGSSKRWSAGATNIVVKNAKKHTPLAAVAINTTTSVNVDIFTRVFWSKQKRLTLSADSIVLYRCQQQPFVCCLEHLQWVVGRGGSVDISYLRCKLETTLRLSSIFAASALFVL